MSNNFKDAIFLMLAKEKNSNVSQGIWVYKCKASVFLMFNPTEIANFNQKDHQKKIINRLHLWILISNLKYHANNKIISIILKSI